MKYTPQIIDNKLLNAKNDDLSTLINKPQFQLTKTGTKSAIIGSISAIIGSKPEVIST